jgi:thioredoxin-dependent peroxiredoxin
MKRVLVLLGAAGLVAAAIVTEEQMGLLSVGDRAPEFTAVLSTGETVSLSDFAGKQTLVLFFYPRDETAGCIAEVCSYRDNYGEIRRLGGAILGVSFDRPDSHDRFITHYHLPFPLIADTGRTLSRQYGAIRWEGPWPRMKRVTYVIDRDGIVRGVFRHELRIGRHTADVLALLGGK